MLRLDARYSDMARSFFLVIASSSLAACGGGSTSPASTVQLTTQDVPVTVIDGPIKGATVCLDKNNNGACDQGEPAGTTDASGKATLAVDKADVGKYPVIAIVGSGAVDADSGPVTMPYVMKAPADQAAVVSPLTTLVQAHIENTGASTADAVAFVKTQIGLSLSPMANYSSSPSNTNDAAAAATVARLVVVAKQQQLSALTALVGTKDSNGVTITSADIDGITNQTMLNAAPAIAAVATDANVISASSKSDRESAIAGLAASIVQSAGVDAQGAATLIETARLPRDTSASSPAAEASLRALTYNDANNWYYRAMESTAADNTPDSNNLVRFYEVHAKNVAGTVTSWGINNSSTRQGDLHWNGNAWMACPLGTRSTQTVRNAQGISDYDYCDKFEVGSSQRSSVDIAGRSLASVVNTIRAFPGGDGGVDYKNWGPSDLNLLGGATFPAGAKLYYQSNVVRMSALAYDVTSKVSTYGTDIGAGGSSSAIPQSACASVTASNSASLLVTATKLEDMINASPGKPCVFASGKDSSGNSSLASNEWWGNSTVSLGVLASMTTPPTPYYSTSAALRVAFAASGNGVTYYRCLTRQSDGSIRNCTAIGTGTYAIQMLGDARVLTFTALPTMARLLDYDRVFVERGGSVYYGYQSRVGTVKKNIRLDMTAANALFAKLGIPAIAPN